ncbi:LytR C-terminal domain-containing protein [Streptomyces gobiensis]|uniref:LytR C-terminal domain-containing protein n=1 Tax=Streptomyces gobiensis TaxID=2875706 RepID=UPI001E5AEF79|nr:LytR C-terminal domain-containing protein [Streptomyces gobiensis]UGY92440.1 LytR C-terminal domain-containing protein [Streptomyces gobiensis]
MSMLTPPGMGGKYRVTGDRYPRMRRPRSRRRIVLGAIATVSALSLIAWGTLQLISVFGGDDEKRVSAKRNRGDCKPPDEPEPRKLPQPSTITVNVYNATPRSGLAKDTAEELKKRGFKIGEIDNAPPEFDKKVKATGLLLGTPKAKKSGHLMVLGAHLAKAQTKTDKAREGKAAKSVDLIIGSGYKDLTQRREAKKVLAALASPSPKPSAAPC